MTPTVAANLPRRLSGYSCVASGGRSLAVSALSALLGASSHVVWDRLAHGHWEHGSNVVGSVIAIALLIGAAPPPTRADSSTRAPLRFWLIAAIVTAGGAVISVRLPGASLAHTTVVRLLLAFAAGCALASRVMRRRLAS